MSYKRYQNTYNEEERKKESSQIIASYPDRVPVIVEPCDGCKLLLDKKKFLVPKDMAFGQFYYIIRKRLKIPPHEAIFCMINNTMPNTGLLFSEISSQYIDKDGFVYINYSSENTFG